MHMNTSKLITGDVVNCWGMECLIDQEITTYPGQGPNPLTVYRTSAKVINLDECKGNGTIAWHEGETYHSGLVPLSWLYPDVFRGGWVKDMDADARWDIQGNELAMWNVTREQYSEMRECERALARTNELLFGKD